MLDPGRHQKHKSAKAWILSRPGFLAYSLLHDHVGSLAQLARLLILSSQGFYRWAQKQLARLFIASIGTLALEQWASNA
jgi:hypothetical protein